MGANPMEATKAGGRTKKEGAKSKASTEPERLRERKVQASNEHAYTLEEVAEMIDKLPEPARTVCAVAAFTGLARSELRGIEMGRLRRRDGQCATEGLGRSHWSTQDRSSRGRRLRGAFAPQDSGEVYSEFPPVGDDWIFRGAKILRPLDLDNLSRREIPQFINGAWFGWHAFRRGLGTRLNEAGVDDKEIQSILRHADVSTTQAYYILPNRERAQAGHEETRRNSAHEVRY